MNVKQFAIVMAPKIVAVVTPEQAGALLGELINTVGKDPRALSLALAHIENEIPFEEALGLWKIVGDIIPGVDRMIGGVLKNDLWFEGIEWEIGTEVPRV